MSEDEIYLYGANDNTYDDMIQPFQLEESNIRGRIIRLGSVLSEILAPQNYPDAVGQLVGEACGLSLLLGGMLKYDGVFTLQAQGEGPVRMLVADLTTSGSLRGMASLDAEKWAAMGADMVKTMRATDRPHDLQTLMGAGHLAFTVDQGDHTERYQGIVELKGPNLAACVEHYFDQSEQIGTMIRVAAGRVNGEWRAGGLMIQRLPVPENLQITDGGVGAEEDWERASALLNTCTEAELINPHLLPGDLLFRLFHEEGVRVFNPQKLSKGCRCNMDKLAGVLKSMSENDLNHMCVNGKITMTCEFCNRNFDFDPKSL